MEYNLSNFIFGRAINYHLSQDNLVISSYAIAFLSHENQTALKIDVFKWLTVGESTHSTDHCQKYVIQAK